MKIYVVRHGQTNGNKEQRMQGRMDIPLNELGISQAKKAYEELRNIKFDKIFCSPLIRTIQTAMIVANAEKNDLIIDDRIVEISFGSMEGKTLDELGGDFVKFFSKPSEYININESESFQSLIKRNGEFLEYLKTVEGNNILVVSHGAAIHAMISYIKKLSLDDFWKANVANCAITEIECNNNKLAIIKESNIVDSNYNK